ARGHRGRGAAGSTARAASARRTRGKTAATFVGQVHRSRQDDCSSRGGAGTARRTFEVELAPRSAYVLAGPARTAWQHHIPPTKNLRYSITFRTLRAPRRGTAPPADGPPPAE